MNVGLFGDQQHKPYSRRRALLGAYSVEQRDAPEKMYISFCMEVPRGVSDTKVVEVVTNWWSTDAWWGSPYVDVKPLLPDGVSEFFD